MSVKGPVVYFELVDKDLHGASDLVDLQQQLSFLPLICAYGGHTHTQKQYIYRCTFEKWTLKGIWDKSE